MKQTRILELAAEIRDLYQRTCELADRHNALVTGDSRDTIKSFRARDSVGIPELNRFESVFDRQDALKKALADPLVRYRHRLFATAAFPLLVAAIYWVQSYSGIGTLWVPTILSVIAFFGVMLIQQWWIRGPILRNLRQQLLDRGVPICLDCGYDLRGSGPGRCPECGGRSTQWELQDRSASAAPCRPPT